MVVFYYRVRNNVVRVVIRRKTAAEISFESQNHYLSVTLRPERFSMARKKSSQKWEKSRFDIEIGEFTAWIDSILNTVDEDESDEDEGYWMMMRVFRRNAEKAFCLENIAVVAENAAEALDLFFTDDDEDRTKELNRKMLWAISSLPVGDDDVNPGFYTDHYTPFSLNLSTLFSVLAEVGCIWDFINYLENGHDEEETGYVEGAVRALGDVVEHLRETELIEPTEDELIERMGKMHHFECGSWSMCARWAFAMDTVEDVFDIDSMTVEQIESEIEKLLDDENVMKKRSQDWKGGFILALTSLQTWIRKYRRVLNPYILVDVLSFIGGAGIRALKPLPYSEECVSRYGERRCSINFLQMLYSIYDEVTEGDDELGLDMLTPVNDGSSIYNRQLCYFLSFIAMSGCYGEESYRLGDLNNDRVDGFFSAVLELIDCRLGCQGVITLADSELREFVTLSYLETVVYSSYGINTMETHAVFGTDEWNDILEEHYEEIGDDSYMVKDHD